MLPACANAPGISTIAVHERRGQDPPFPPFRVRGSMVEHRTFNPDHVGSIPTVPTKPYAALIRAIISITPCVRKGFERREVAVCSENQKKIG